MSFDTPFAKIGIGICYDVRFAELGQIYASKGCQLLIYPGAFNMTTGTAVAASANLFIHSSLFSAGPAHWQPIARGRALDNQVFVALVSPARDEDADYVAWGHSTIVDPWGEVLQSLDEKEDTILVDLDLTRMAQIRNQIPITKQRRDDLYEVRLK